ncbi:hypothetical protein [Kitasatospora sp. NPDC047058]
MSQTGPVPVEAAVRLAAMAREELGRVALERGDADVGPGRP